MLHRLFTAALLLTGLATPALAETTTVKHLPVPSVSDMATRLKPQVSQWSSNVDWQKLTPAQKALFVSGVFDGLCAQESIQALDQNKGPKPDLARMRAALQAHQKETISQLDAAFAKYPKQNALVLAAMIARFYMPSEVRTGSASVSATAAPMKH